MRIVFSLLLMLLVSLAQICDAQMGRTAVSNDDTSFASTPSVVAANSSTVELQNAIRRFMQCQADNVSAYNEQTKIMLDEIRQVRAELEAAKRSKVGE